MSHDEEHRASTKDKLVRMANQIGTFFQSKPHDMGVAGVAEHINKFWDPRMRKQFFELIDSGTAAFLPMVVEASATIRRPGEPISRAEAVQIEQGPPGGKGIEAGETISRIAASQG